MTAENTVLRAWVDAGWLRELDLGFADFLAREAPDAHALLLLAAALASHQLGRGHACLDLAATLADPQATLGLPPERDASEPADARCAPPPSPAALLAGLDLAQWQRALRHPALVADGAGHTPLVLEGARLYLRRYWQHERTVREGLRARLGPLAQQPPQAALAAALDALFPGTGDGFPGTGDGFPGTGAGFDWQKAACAIAATSRLAIVTGGPGTGKTTTVVKLLAVLQHLAIDHGDARPLRIRLAAPTGKAAARLNASIADAVGALQLDALGDAARLRSAIPTRVATVHRLLGSIPDSRRFRHVRGHPLPVDVLVVDEASMVDLELMAALVDALPPHARMVLLGDKDQLASVEAGAVLGELCRRADAGHYTPDTAARLHALTGQSPATDFVDPQGTPMDQAIVKLRRSWRFDDASGIGRLAAAVKAGDGAAARRVLDAPGPEVAWVADTGTGLDRLLLDGREGDAPGHAAWLQRMHATCPPADADPAVFDAWARDLLQAFGRFQVLCALRHGPSGVSGLNARIERLLQARELLADTAGWYAGRPVMVTRNDPVLGLMNGDVGLTLPCGPRLRVAFADTAAAGGVRWLLPARLPSVETVHAMTVHKSQGSEFDHAVLVLPQHDSRVLTRELVYTAITRARRWFTLVGGGEGGLLNAALVRRTQRAGGELAA